MEICISMRVSILICIVLVSSCIIGLDTHDELIQRSGFLKSNSPTLGPTIEWHDDPNETIFFDGVYTGQTGWFFEWTAHVNDSDGVDTVLFRFKKRQEETWINRSTVIIEGDEVDGEYQGNITWKIPWPEKVGVRFQLKVWANDTLGNWNETIPLNVSYGYYIICTTAISQDNNWFLTLVPITIGSLMFLVLMIILNKRRTQ